MSWEQECVEIVRVLINDISDVLKYEDCRIERVLVVSATQLIQEVSFPTTYTISVAGATISPDPTDDVRDTAFINLWCLKTALIITGGEMRKYALAGIKVTDGPSTIDVSSAYNAIKGVYTDLQMKYEKERMLYQMSRSGQSITTPSTYWDFTNGPLGD